MHIGVDYLDGESSAALALFRDRGVSAVGIANGPLGQGISAKNARSGKMYELRLDDQGELSVGDGSGSARRLV